MKNGTFLFVALLVSTLLAAQQIERRTFNASSKAAQVYIEALGSGIIYSINYDQRLAKKENGFGIRVGTSRYKGEIGESRSTIPVQLNYLFGTGGKYFEAGVGTTYGGGRNISNESTGNFIGTATLGYRRQPFEKRGLTWRIALTPLIVFQTPGVKVLPWIGSSLGFRF